MYYLQCNLVIMFSYLVVFTSTYACKYFIFFFLLLRFKGRYTELHSKYKEAVNTAKEQKELIGQLETDLLSVNALPSAFRGQGEVSQLHQQLMFVL